MAFTGDGQAPRLPRPGARRPDRQLERARIEAKIAGLSHVLNKR